MLIKIENIASENLLHTFKITVPAAVINQKLSDEFLKKQTNTTIKGFRKGAISIEKIKTMFGNQIYDQVVNDCIEKSFAKLLKEKSLKNAEKPQVTDIKYEPDQDLTYQVKFEALPKIKEKIAIPELTLTKYVPAITDDEIQDEIKKLIANTPKLQPKNLPCAAGDYITIELLEEDKKQPRVVQILLGANQLPADIEAKIIGKNCGDSLKTKIKIASSQKGATSKSISIKITVKEIATSTKHQNLDDLLTTLKIKTSGELITLIKNQFQQQAEELSFSLLKENIFDHLNQKISIECPKDMIHREVKVVLNELKLPENTENMNKYQAIAHKRVKLGLIAAEITNQFNIKPSEEDIKDELMLKAKTKGPNVVQQFMQNEAFRAEVMTNIVEKKIVNIVSGKSKINEKKVSGKELVKLFDVKNKEN